MTRFKINWRSRLHEPLLTQWNAFARDASSYLLRVHVLPLVLIYYSVFAPSERFVIRACLRRTRRIEYGTMLAVVVCLLMKLLCLAKKFALAFN